MGKLVIVESNAKAKTIQKYLGKGFKVLSCLGHIRDLPKKEFGVDIEKDFEPKYVILDGRKTIVTQIKKAAKDSDEILIATDPDREGEAIAWHLAHLLEGSQLKRIEFNEITERAIKAALENPREIDGQRVNAQQARRILDRIVGYQLSPLLWKFIKTKTSAGRVQSAALRLIVDREDEIDAFVPEEYWYVFADLAATEGDFRARLATIGGKEAKIGNGETASEIIERLKGEKFSVAEVKEKTIKRSPPPPFITSTLQQEASRSLGFTSKRTMALAQNLYEGIALGTEGPVGLITYMRTDSTRIADEALEDARSFISENYDNKYLPEKARRFKTGKKAQDAHEAIRPSDVALTPEIVAGSLSPEQAKLYSLIWRRFVACQMEGGTDRQKTIDVGAADAIFRVSQVDQDFDGFRVVYGGRSAKNGNSDKKPLPPLTRGQDLDLLNIEGEQNFTKPPARFNTASIVKAMEEEGIGRPSTYAPTVDLLQTRGYINREKGVFFPTILGRVIVHTLKAHFKDVVDIKFTAAMEENLDKVEVGEREWHQLLGEFYKTFSRELEEVSGARIKPYLIGEDCPECSKPLQYRFGRYGPFISCTDYPTCKYSRPIAKNGNGENGGAGPGEDKPTHVPESRECPDCGKEMTLRKSRYGWFYGCTSYPKCKATVPVSFGLKCPEEGCDGEIVGRRGKKGKVFYGCTKYPDCKYTSWTFPKGLEKVDQAAAAAEATEES